MNYLRLTALMLLLLPGLAANAQSKKKSSNGSSSSGSGYKTGIGLRGGGWSSGLTLKHFLGSGKGVAIEGLLTTEYKAHGGRLTILGEKHMGVADVKGLQFYYGAGFHAGAYQGRYYFADDRFYYDGRNGDVYLRRGKNGFYYTDSYYYDTNTYLAIGADLILGLEYKLPDLPFVVGVDYKPFFEVFHGYTGFYNDAAVSLRVTF
ncbi:hypothetical protein I7X13_05360 [Hymenobacter sp. BT442]|uniref:Outer membrane protein beta-barrel domain-containing protein n=2 Tax=Hymenobacter negativus TaxID=2795026 RepID=A0ABS0Q477_9BACT|nr:hypothetical protein [Hymenobacter negativus]MBH8568003.1 hypothetical protein [Hymenobacter negativus]